MAYDVLSGTIALPGELLSDGQVSASIFQPMPIAWLVNQT